MREVISYWLGIFILAGCTGLGLHWLWQGYLRLIWREEYEDIRRDKQ